jgi:hypothetical protein
LHFDGQFTRTLLGLFITERVTSGRDDCRQCFGRYPSHVGRFDTRARDPRMGLREAEKKLQYILSGYTVHFKYVHVPDWDTLT